MTRTNKSPLRAGLSGCGGISSLTLDAAERSPDFEVVALQDPALEAANRLGDHYGIASRPSTFEALLAQDLDFVILNGPNHVHAEQTVAAVAAGHPVLVQKPMARNAAEARRMVAAADRAGVALGVTMTELGRPLHHDLRDLIRLGFIGAPVLVEACLAHGNYLRSPPPVGDWRRDRDKVGGGAFAQLAVHHVGLVSWLLDRPVTEVGALGSSGHTELAEETTIAVARFAGGAIASFTASWATDAVRVCISGTEGRIDVSEDRIVASGNRAFSGTVLGPIAAQVPLAVSMTDVIDAGRPRARELEVHARFARSLRGDDTYPWPGARGLSDMEVLEAVARSRESGRIEPVVMSEEDDGDDDE